MKISEQESPIIHNHFICSSVCVPSALTLCRISL